MQIRNDDNRVVDVILINPGWGEPDGRLLQRIAHSEVLLLLVLEEELLKQDVVVEDVFLFSVVDFDYKKAPLSIKHHQGKGIEE